MINKYMEDKYIQLEKTYCDYIYNNCVNRADTERNHINADKFLTDFLLELGFKDIVETFNEVNKWYA